ncbi:alpha/beta fold hydrolase, partial [Acinetobacter nosocomialis]|uniref:alpha/beta fold hydrolase n=1 Tax=Acinetobacter nosocomialis TaxID=106654 RepID=UPI003AF64756
MQQLTLQGFTHASYLLAYDELRNYLSDLKVPCSVIAGQQDQITPALCIQELDQVLQLEQRFVIEDAGHLSYFDQPQAFNEIMLSFNDLC